MDQFDQRTHDASEPEIFIDTRAKLPDADPPDVDIVGERFGKYFIVGELAIGGMAEVFLAVKRGLEGFLKVVVLKRVLQQFSSDPEFVRMFINEARLAARLEHPNIVRTYEFGEVNGQYFTTMEYLPGEDLAKVLDRLVFSRQHLPIHVAAGIISQVCAGLHFAHQLTDTTGHLLNLVHRDVNPANIIITYGGEVKIIDFGVAKTNANHTVNSSIKGKLSYMSPEQLVKRGVDARSDVFSTGIVLWELLVGRPLFTRHSEAATLYAIMNDPIPTPSRYRPDVPRELDIIAKRALARLPGDRYSSCEEMGDALERFLATQPKYDARVVARTVEELFGRTRAEAKRSIGQSRSLSRNVSLVMKLRTDMKAELSQEFDAIESGREEAAPARAETEPPARTWRALPAFFALLLLGGVTAGLFYVLSGSDPAAPSAGASATRPPAGASLQITSTPAGASISIGGEPTGLKTPVTITGLTAKEVLIRLELPDYGTTTERMDVPAGATLTRHFNLTRPRGRLVIAGLPRGAVVFVDGEEFEAGELIDVGAGTREVRIAIDGKTLVQQSIETSVGDQRWELAGERLIATTP
jgi:eukaryotic-like serine/threonine-protein kinase